MSHNGDNNSTSILPHWDNIASPLQQAWKWDHKIALQDLDTLETCPTQVALWKVDASN